MRCPVDISVKSCSNRDPWQRDDRTMYSCPQLNLRPALLRLPHHIQFRLILTRAILMPQLCQHTRQF
ncbi:hypothetical protein Pat9b_5065 (plasmid) [Pantoea sp. At-9b]|nr:hypothetical protein Pat9b_5065 [Pantoea sp. At-9b]